MTWPGRKLRSIPPGNLNFDVRRLTWSMAPMGISLRSGGYHNERLQINRIEHVRAKPCCFIIWTTKLTIHFNWLQVSQFVVVSCPSQPPDTTVRLRSEPACGHVLAGLVYSCILRRKHGGLASIQFVKVLGTEKELSDIVEWYGQLYSFWRTTWDERGGGVVNVI